MTVVELDCSRKSDAELDLWSFHRLLRGIGTQKLSPNQQIKRISAILQDGVPRTILSASPGDVAYLVGNEKSFCSGQVEDDQCLVK
jgi:hypothetical protein